MQCRNINLDFTKKYISLNSNILGIQFITAVMEWFRAAAFPSNMLAACYNRTMEEFIIVAFES